MGSERRTDPGTMAPRGGWSVSDAEDGQWERRQPPPDEGPLRRFVRKLGTLFQLYPRGPFGQ